jgi:hypothetical protein
MKVKNYNDAVMAPEYEAAKEYSGNKSILSKSDYDLFFDEKNIVERVVRIKRSDTKVKGERWKIFADNEVVFILDGTKISKKDREYLRTPEGFSFLIVQFKNGLKSVDGLKKALRSQRK